jgi:hypothetical protein
MVTGTRVWHARPVKAEEHADPPERRLPQRVRIVHLTAPVFRALANGELAVANTASTVAPVGVLRRS